MVRNILLTGGLGFVGTNFLETIPKLPEFIQDTFYCLDKNTYSVDITDWQKNIPKNVHLIIGDMTNFEFMLNLFNRFKINFVVHLGAETHVDKSFECPLNFLKHNVFATHVLLECTRLCKTKIENFVHMSTDEVYGSLDMEDEPCNEKNRMMNPTNVYASTKLCAEYLVKSYNHSYKLKCNIVRCTNLYGNAQYPDKLIPLFYKLIKENKKLTIHGNGLMRRRYIHVNDLIHAFEYILLRNNELPMIVQVGSTSNEYNVLEMAEKIIHHVHGCDANMEDYIVYVEDRIFNDFRYNLDVSVLESLNWKEQVSIDDGLQKTFAWYDENGYKRWLFL